VPRVKRHAGFALIEVLVALVLLSLGLLGAGHMLLAALQSQADALHEMAAAQLVRDMADRIRANPRAGAAYDWREAEPPAASCELAAPCAAPQLAALDLAHFLAAAQRALPGVETRAQVEFEPAIGPAAADRFAITLSWRGPRDDDIRVVALSLLAPPVAG
jgi:type IV pilus assembly protein PilV